LASSLAKLDFSLAKPCTTLTNNYEIIINSLKHSYKRLIAKFDGVGEITNSVFIYSLNVARKVKEKAANMFTFGVGEFKMVYAACLFLSIKMVIDVEKWYIEDFSNVSGLEKELITKMEMFIVEDILNFNVSVQRVDYRHEHLRIYKNIEKRKLKNDKN
jgi:hypothetical protein